jgi:NAD(P)-dependent dehydrogenase (short-subunit alcohol dehydrogenase family)
MPREHFARLSEAERAAYTERQRQQILLGGTLGDPDRDLTPVMVFLAGVGSRFITGQIIAVNGGSESVR